MTCIVGLVARNRVLIGGDSAGVAGLDLMIRADTKVFRNGPFLIGFTSSFRMGQLLRYSLKPPVRPAKMSTDCFMVTIFMDSVRDCLKAGGYAKKKEEQEEGGYFIVGYEGRLYTVNSDYQIEQGRCDFSAVGCGSQVALGCLFASPSKKPRERVLLALRAAEAFSAGVRSPFVVREL